MIRFIPCLLLAGLAASPAFAQTASQQAPLPTPEEVQSGDALTIGVGAAITPDYEGSDDYRIIPAAAIRGRYHGISFSTNGLYLSADVLNGKGMVDFDLGPVVGLRLNRTGKIKDDIVDLLPDRKTAVEVGGFAGVSFRGLTNPYDSLSLHLQAVHDVASAHKSTVLTPSVSFATPLSHTLYASLSASADFVSNRFARYYYSITPADAVVSGLPVFDAGGGMKDWKLSLLANQSLSGDLLHGLSLFGTGSYSRLVGDFKRSPIVSQRGSASQWFGALGVAYSW
jgi:outer membrane protein